MQVIVSRSKSVLERRFELIAQNKHGVETKAVVVGSKGEKQESLARFVICHIL